MWRTKSQQQHSINKLWRNEPKIMNEWQPRRGGGEMGRTERSRPYLTSDWVSVSQAAAAPSLSSGTALWRSRVSSWGVRAAGAAPGRSAPDTHPAGVASAKLHPLLSAPIPDCSQVQQPAPSNALLAVGAFCFLQPRCWKSTKVDQKKTCNVIPCWRAVIKREEDVNIKTVAQWNAAEEKLVQILFQSSVRWKI